MGTHGTASVRGARAAARRSGAPALVGLCPAHAARCRAPPPHAAERATAATAETRPQPATAVRGARASRPQRPQPRLFPMY
jgi:hypothetical protein